MPSSKIGERIKALREERKLSQTDVEKIAKINSHLISKYENGIVEPTITNLQKIARALQVSADYLIFDGEKKEKVEFNDPILKEQFLLVDKMDNRDREVIKALLNTYIKKNQMESILKG